MSESIGNSIYELAEKLFPICRSLSGDGVRESLRVIQNYVPELQMHEVKSGTKCFDWIVPDEWNIKDAYIIDPDGNKIAEFEKSNLHVVGYSLPVDRTMPWEELDKHLHSIEGQPDAIPYVTSYYKKEWGFCLPHNQRKSLKKGDYKVFIDSSLKPGHLTYGECVFPGQLDEEVFISTNICHPSLANDELSGPIVATFIAKHLAEKKDRRYTYRLIWIPETIGAIIYLSKHLAHLKEKVIAGYTLSCLGDDNSYSMIESRLGNTLSDRVADHVLKHMASEYEHYSYLDRGSDERQYCSPKIDLPIASLSRTKADKFPEYHTSNDNLEFISPQGLAGGHDLVVKCLDSIERNQRYKAVMSGEPQLSKYGVYPTLSKKGSAAGFYKNLLDVLAYSDGNMDLLQISEKLDIDMQNLFEITDILLAHKLIE